MVVNTICFFIFLHSIFAAVFGAFIMVLLGLPPEHYGLSFLNPNTLYETGKVNWFGAYFLGILLSLIFAHYALIYWIYKLCTLGRR